ncbi:hypothetical protein Z043_120397 [Scleropages formosus]|uniref:Uncharacterized protein n=1 Tax=Scleropages formosus TaxID=113540 RepID=A0A0P7Y711_SCLFO|nr:hypothetical protein Z043_120397 [Scleropages formosus]
MSHRCGVGSGAGCSADRWYVDLSANGTLPRWLHIRRGSGPAAEQRDNGLERRDNAFTAAAAAPVPIIIIII